MDYLTPGSTIAVFSPSAPATITSRIRYERAKAYLISKGFHIFEGNLTGKKDYYRSGSILDRAQEFNALIHNPQVDCIMSSIGGYNTNSILPYIDYDAFQRNPKVVVGYSDVTALLLAIYQKTGVTTYYGPAMVASFGEFPPLVDLTYQYFMDIVGTKHSFPHVLQTPDIWTDEFIDWDLQNKEKNVNKNNRITLKQGIATGRLIAGNLNTMYGIWGTEYMPEIQLGDILLLEDSFKNAAEVERAFAHLKLAGVFDKIAGLILGKHEKFNDMGTARTPADILLEVLGNFHFPLLVDFDCAHTHPMLTVPIGCSVTLNTISQTLTILK